MGLTVLRRGKYSEHAAVVVENNIIRDEGYVHRGFKIQNSTLAK